MENRDLDAQIAEKIFGWKLSPVGNDAKGENSCEVLFPPGEENNQNYYSMLPNIGKPHKGFLTPQYSSNLKEAIKVSVRANLKMDISEIDFGDWQLPEKLAKRALEFWASEQK